MKSAQSCGGIIQRCQPAGAGSGLYGGPPASLPPLAELEVDALDDEELLVLSGPQQSTPASPPHAYESAHNASGATATSATRAALEPSELSFARPRSPCMK